MRLLAVIALLGLGSGVFGLKCWNCQNAVSNEECNALGSLQTCRRNQVCINQETTSADGSKYQITKGCRIKTVPVCGRSDPQNYGSYPTNCKYGKEGSTCTCCCDSEQCNGPQTECKVAVTCRRPDKPGNGMIRCPKPITYGSKCVVKCMRGYVLSGPATLTCTNSTNEGFWNPRVTAACLARTSHPVNRSPTMCKKPMTAPEHGSMVCENRMQHRDKRTYNYVGSRCAFKCDAGYFLKGRETAACLAGGRWSTTKPECTKGMCQKPRSNKNRIDICSDENYFGSVCNMQCTPGFRLIGSDTSTCTSVNDQIRQGRWSDDFPQCVLALCRPQLRIPTNGEMKCTKKNRLGSICTFGCDDGYDLTDIGNTNDGNVECVENADSVEWNGSPPTCTKIVCPRLEMPENGNLACVGDGSLGSHCSFGCSVGYDLVGSDNQVLTTNCTNAGTGDGIGTWTVESVICAEVRCQPERVAPENGAVYCSNENKLGSTCTFTCNASYDMDGTAARLTINICEADFAGDGQGKWSSDPATCSTRYYCSVAQTDPEFGTVSCDDEAYLGSVCQFACEEGYELKGIGRITCMDLTNDGDAEVEWSSPTPECIPSTCSEQWYDSTIVNRQCNNDIEGNEFTVGTRCTYECSDVGYYLESEEGEGATIDITCTAKNTWSRPAAPRCFVKTCPRLELIENGNQPECTNGNRYGSQCRYKCNDKYSPTHTDPLICETTGREDKESFWNIEPPTCILNECEATPSNPSKGKVECSSGARMGSYCTLECDRGYAPRIPRIDCQLSSETINGEEVDVPKFLHMGDFCCAQCRSDFHVVLAVDARSTRAVQNVVDFAKIFLSQLSGQDNAAYFSAFTYNVESHGIIEEVSVGNADELTEIYEQIEAWEVAEEAGSSDTKAALEFASDTMFASLDSNAANFLIVAADDSPDNVNSALLSRLADRGIQIIVAPSNNFSKIKWERLLNGGDGVVNQDASSITNRMYDLAFQDGCSNTAPQCV